MVVWDAVADPARPGHQEIVWELELCHKKELQLGSLARKRVIEVGADQLKGAGAGRDYGWSEGRNYGQGEGGGGYSWPVGGNSGSLRVLLQDNSNSRVCRVTDSKLCDAKLLAI